MSVAGASMGEGAERRWFSRATSRTVGIAIGLLGIVLTALLSLRFGSIDVSTRDAWDALFNYNAGAAR